MRPSHIRLNAARIRLVLSALVAVSVCAIPAVARAAAPTVRCTDYSQSATVPASLEPTTGQPVPYTVVGELCATSSELRDGSTVQLLDHGGSYNHSYWDFGTIDGVQYSYARELAAAGFPTFAFDQLGAGQSSKPPCASLTNCEVTNEVTAYVDHELVQGLRAGSLAGVRFGKVIAVGHSIGSLSVWQEAITYHDVDGLIITGAVHHLSTIGSTAGAQDSYPAYQDPNFQNQQWAISNPGYVTTRPGTRVQLFYNSADADPEVIAADDNTRPFSQSSFADEPGKDVFAAGQFDGFGLYSSTATRAIEVPVLVITGSEDALLCGADSQGGNYDCSSGTAIAAQEAPYYSPQAQLQACSVPTSGHSISLHYTFGVQEGAAIAWSYRYIGQNGHTSHAALPAACG